MLNIDEIRNILPQRYPFLMIDRVTEYHKEGLVATKKFTADEWFFQSAGNDIVPEVLLMEAASQAAIILTYLYKRSQEKTGPVPEPGTGPVGSPGFSSGNFIPLIGKIKAEFLIPVHVGTEVKILSSINKLMSDKGFFNTRLEVELTHVGDVEIFAVLKPHPERTPHG